MHNVISITAGTAYRSARTSDEISAELSTLTKLNELIPSHAAFGDSNHEAIDAQMEVLREQVCVADVVERWEEDYIQAAALTAADWLRGEDYAPSAGWLDLVGDGDGWMN